MCRVPVLGSGQESVIRLLEALEFLYQDGGNQMKTQLLQSPGKFEGPSLRERISAASTRVFSTPQPQTSSRTGTPDPPPPHRPNQGTQQPGSSPCSFSPSLPPSWVRKETQRSGLIHQSGRKGGGERRRAAGGGVSPRPAALGGAGGGGAPFPPRADCCGILPVPARVCEGERVRWVGPMGVIEGFREAEWRFPLPSE